MRVSVDRRNEEGLYILTGSNSVDKTTIMHTGTGRIDTLKMYPMSLFESGESNGSVSLSELFKTGKLSSESCISTKNSKDSPASASGGGIAVFS